MAAALDEDQMTLLWLAAKQGWHGAKSKFTLETKLPPWQRPRRTKNKGYQWDAGMSYPNPGPWVYHEPLWPHLILIIGSLKFRGARSLSGIRGYQYREYTVKIYKMGWRILRLWSVSTQLRSTPTYPISAYYYYAFCTGSSPYRISCHHRRQSKCYTTRA